jgi:hypothetical protein
LTRGMVACLPDLGTACPPVCRNCGQELVEQDDPPDTDRGRRYWQRTCGCVIEPEPEKDFGFTEEKLSKFAALVGLSPATSIKTASHAAPRASGRPR